MTQLNIEGRVVQVDDGFLKLSPADQDATVQDIGRQLGLGQSSTPDIGQGRAEGTSLLRGVPIAGALADPATAAVNAAFPGVAAPGMSHAPTFGERYRENLPRVTQGVNTYEEANPVASTITRMAGGAGAMAPLGAIAPVARAMGMTGTLPQMVLRGGATGFGIGGADTLARGGTPEQALESGVINAGAAGAMPLAGRALGLGAKAVRNLVGSAERIPHSVDLAGTQVPVRQSYVTPTDAVGSKEQQDIAGVHGPEAQEIARAADARTQAATQQAAQGFGEQMRGGPGPAQSMADKSAAAHQTITELAQQHNDQEQAQARADAQNVAEQASIRGNIAAPLGAPEVGPRTALEAMEGIQNGVEQAAERSRANVGRLYQTASQFPGAYSPAAWSQARQTIQNEIDRRAQAAGHRPVTINPGVTPRAQAMLDVIEQRLNPPPLRPAPRASATPPQARSLAQDIADIRAQYGDVAASKYLQQQQTKTNPGAQSLLEFLAAKGGLGPDAELEAIGAHSHTVNVEGVGRRKLVRQGGWPLDYAREAAEEAGYLPSGSTPADLLDTIDAEMRGQKRYPAGFEGTQTRREVSAASEREQHEFERRRQGFEDDLAAAGHGELGPEVKQRAMDLMDREGIGPDEAVDHALAQLEQEDAAGHGGFPGDRAASPAASTPQGLEGLTPHDIEAVRKELVGLLKDANRAARAPGGSGTDAYAAQRVMDAFNHHHEAILNTPGAFTGEGSAYLQAIRAARAAHAQDRQTFANQGQGDRIGPIIERIVGRHEGQEMPPGEMAKAIYGTVNGAGGGSSAMVMQRVRDIVGADSPVWQNARSGVLSHVLEAPSGEPYPVAKQADRLAAYAATPHAREMFTPAERTRMMAHANDLRAQATEAPPPRTTAQRAVNKLAVEQNPLSFVKQIFSANGDLSAGADAMLAEIKDRVSQRTFNSIRQAMWLHLIEKPEGLVNWEPRELSNRIARFLNNPAAEKLYSQNEIGVLRQFQQHFDKLAPLPNTTNPSGTAVMHAKLARGFARHFFKMLGLTHGLSGIAVGHLLDEAAGRGLQARQIAKTKDLFLGKRASGTLNNQYEQAGALLGNLARPASLNDQSGPR